VRYGHGGREGVCEGEGVGSPHRTSHRGSTRSSLSNRICDLLRL
jgi:hypothetical protein